jgi:hypothetical protein
MQLKEYIINTALIGTDKKSLSVNELPEQLRSSATKLFEKSEDSESLFLKTAALALNYYRGGIEPIKLNLNVEKAEDETGPYCSDSATAVLKDILEEKYYSLVWFWTKCCVEKNQIVQARLLPKYFEWGASTRKTTIDLFSAAIGKRGIWLAKFKAEWSFVSKAVEEFDWETSGIVNRVKYLEQLRKENSPDAVEKIKQVWKEENAASRAELISALFINLSKSDEEFLVPLLSDKSQKVKEKAFQLIKQIPSSAIIESYKNCVRQSIQITQSKMLGLISRTTVQVNLKVSDESIFTTGIQKLSSTKEISDDDFILMQMIAEIPPSFWSEQFAMNTVDVIKAFGKDELKKFQPSLIKAVVKFNDSNWAKEILENFDAPSVELLQLIHEDERIGYAPKFLKENTDEMIASIRTENLKEWNRKFVKQLLPMLADNPSRYNRVFFENIVIYLPLEIMNDLDDVAATEEWKKGHWNGIKEEVKKLLSLKEQIKKAFA